MSEQNRTIADEVDDDDIEKIKDDFKDEPKTVKLRVNRVPKYVSDDLKTLANEKFAGDYGMALTFWHLEHQRNEDIHQVISSLTARVARLENYVQDLINNEEEKDSEEELNTING